MALPVLPFEGTIGPAQGSAHSVEPRVLKAQFGDGYLGRAGDGINPIHDEYTVSFETLDATESEQLWDFLVAQAGYKAFLWTAPRTVVQRKWIAPKWSRTHTTGAHDTVQASFIEVFDP